MAKFFTVEDTRHVSSPNIHQICLVISVVEEWRNKKFSHSVITLANGTEFFVEERTLFIHDQFCSGADDTLPIFHDKVFYPNPNRSR